jgi:cytochrome c peroxidase
MRVSFLEDQVTDVLSNEKEMHGSVSNSISKLKRTPAYVTLFQRAFPESKECITPYHFQNAIASFLRSLISLNARFDKYMRGDYSQMNKDEVAGFNLYMGKAKCGTCHFVPLFNGVLPPDFIKSEAEVIGVPSVVGGRHIDEDKGLYLIHPAEPYLYAFKIPTLRNIILTAPYMHNGAFKTLEEVLDFYNRGGARGIGISLPNQTLSPISLQLTKTEQRNIISFLHALTDTSYSGMN